MLLPLGKFTDWDNGENMFSSSLELVMPTDLLPISLKVKGTNCPTLFKFLPFGDWNLLECFLIENFYLRSSFNYFKAI